MFDVSFSELLVIAVVALVVIGPEKLPKVARTAGALMGRFQRYAAQIKEEVNREARFEELQKLQQEIKQGVQQAESSFNQAAQKIAEAPAEITKAVRRTKAAKTTKTVKSAAKPQRKTKPKTKPEQS